MSLFGDEGGWGLPTAPVISPVVNANIPGINDVLNRIGGGVLGSQIGAISPLGPLGSILGGATGVMNPGAMDPGSWARAFGAGNKSKATYGSDMPTPELAGFEAMNWDKLGSRLNQGGLDAYRQRATQVGDSPWAAMMKQRQGVEQANLLNQAAQNSATQAATAKANLAMTGGLRGGAAERLAGAAGNDLALARQNVLNQGVLARMGIGIQDEAIKNQFLQGLPGQELAQANYLSNIDQTNAARNAANAAALNQYNLTKYGEQMKMKGAGMSAQAIENAGKK